LLLTPAIVQIGPFVKELATRTALQRLGADRLLNLPFLLHLDGVESRVNLVVVQRDYDGALGLGGPVGGDVVGQRVELLDYLVPDLVVVAVVDQVYVAVFEAGHG